MNRIGYELAQQTGFPKYPFTFRLVDLAVPNAFALPGGQIFITRGMLDLGLDDDMLAAVLGHEIAHVTLEHYLRLQRKANLLNVLGNVLVAGVLVHEANTDNRRSTYEAPYDPRVGRDPGGDLVQGAAAASLVLSRAAAAQLQPRPGGRVRPGGAAPGRGGRLRSRRRRAGSGRR